MKKFGEILDNAVMENRWSKSKFVDSFSLNRGNYYKIVNSKTRMTEEMFNNMIKKNDFSKGQKDLLRESYWQESFSPDALKRILYIIDSLNALSSEKNIVKKLEPYTPKSSCESIVGLTNIVRAIEFITTDELNKDVSQIYTNYSFSNTNIDNHIFSILNNSSKKINFNHIVRFDKEGKSTNNLSNLFSCIKYAKNEYTTYYNYMDNKVSDEIDILYPNYFISSSYILLFNTSDNIGIISSDSNLINASITSAKLVIQRSQSLVSYYDNVFEFKNELEKHQLHLIGSFDSFPCVAALADENIVEAMIRKDIPNRNSVVQAIIHHFSIMSDEKYNSLFDKFYSVSATKIFANTGETYVAGHDIAPTYPIEIRKFLLEKLLNNMKREKFRKTHFLDELKLTMPTSFFLEFSGSGLIIAIRKENEVSFYGQCLISFTDANILADLNNFMKYVIKAGYCLPNDYVEFFLKDVIVSLDK